LPLWSFNQHEDIGINLCQNPIDVLTYLTVQDVLWTHFQILKRTSPYQFASLEEATFYQYAYGKSEDVLAQASRFFTGFCRKAPFEHGNEATAFVVMVALLELNGFEVTVKDSDAASWVRSARPGETEWLNQGIRKSEGGHDHGKSDVKVYLNRALETFPITIKALQPAAV
jgi:prophage maintenance system killer protein